MVVVQQVAVQPQVRGHGFGQGVVGAFVGGAFLDPLGGLIGQQTDRLGVAEGIVVNGAGDGAFEQRKAVVLGGSRLGQNDLGFVARHAMSVPVVVTPRR